MPDCAGSGSAGAAGCLAHAPRPVSATAPAPIAAASRNLLRENRLSAMDKTSAPTLQFGYQVSCRALEELTIVDVAIVNKSTIDNHQIENYDPRPNSPKSPNVSHGT